MRCPRKLIHFLSLIFFHFVLVIISGSQADTLAKQRPFNYSISAVFVFGDSTVDPGNNNYIGTAFKSNFPPYGRDFVNHIPTGRFTNGRLVTDFIASYVGVKDNVPPYLDPTLSIEELMTGISFASAGSGFDPFTPTISGVIPIFKQLEYFREYRTRLELVIGMKRTKNLINKAVFIVSAGTNDFVVNYFGTVPIRRHRYTVFGYQQFLMEQVQRFIQDLLDEGVQKMGIVGLPPIGCLPEVITLYSNAFHQRDCIEMLSSIATDYNQMLQRNLKAMQNSLSTVILYADIYTPISNMIQGQRSFGFDEVNIGCCGTGLFEGAFLCNPESPVCMNASKYVFWDAIHPTEAAYSSIFHALLPTIHLLVK